MKRQAVAQFTLDSVDVSAPLQIRQAPPAGHGQPPQGPTTLVDTFRPDQWDEVVASFDDAQHENTASLAADIWGHQRLSHIAIRDAHGIRAAAQVLILRPPGLTSGPGIAHAKFAPLWHANGRQADIADLRACLDAMVDTYARERGLCLTIVPQANPDTLDTVCDELGRLGFRRRRGLAIDHRFVVNCTLSEDEQLASLGQKWRYNLKKSLKNGLAIRIVDGQEGIDAFMSLHREMRARKNYQEYTWVERYPRLVSTMPAELLPRVVLAEHEGAPTAGAIVSCFGHTASYLFGGTDSRALRLRAGYALQWWILQWLSQQGVRWYDLDSDSGSPGLAQFKSGLAGKAGCRLELPGEFDYCESTASKLVAAGLQSARRLRNAVQAGGDTLRGLYSKS